MQNICGVRTFGRMFEAAVNDSAKQLWLQDEVTEIGCVDTDIMSPT